MSRLNYRAYQILCAEIQNCVSNNAIGKAEQEIVVKRLERLQTAAGSPASLDELRDTVVDIFPQFSEKALKAAARANQPPGPVGKLKWSAGILLSLAGVLWVANLPYPMIRWPIARTVPILLLPSYMAMDRDYRSAIALVEQADQLINKATSAADFELGAEKVKEAQKHLDALPVWFLGYWPQYTSRFGWQFTFDEFQNARRTIGRMDAQIFQEKNAQAVLSQGEQKLNSAKQQYQQASTQPDKEKAIASWQAAIDQIAQIPQATLAGRTAQSQLTAYKRDFQQVAGRAASSSRSSTLIEVAQQFAIQADSLDLNLPHTAAEWQQNESLWSEAINKLKQVSLEESGYIDAQKLQVSYQTKLGNVQIRLQAEKESLDALQQAQNQIQNFLASIPSDAKSVNRNVTISQIQGIINQLEKVRSGTTAYPKAQELLQFAKNKLNQLEPK